MSSNAPLLSPVSVIGSEFITPNQMDLIFDKGSDGHLVITDIDHHILLKVKQCNSSFHRQRVLLDADDKTVVKIREKMTTAHNRWNVSRGSGSDKIFTTKKTSMIQFRTTTLRAFLKNKTSRSGVRDFKIKGRWSKSNFTIYIGDTSTPIAQMYENASSEKSKSNVVMDKFMVRIEAGVDYAFVVTLIAVVEAMEFDSDTPSGIGYVILPLQLISGLLDAMGS